MLLRQIYDEDLAQAAWLLGCQKTGEAIVIDPERDVDRYLQLASEHGLRIVAVAETHINADFLSGARALSDAVGARVMVSGEGGDDWSSRWLEDHPHQELHDGDVFRIGGIEFKVHHTPGHTPEHISFLVTDVGGGADEPLGFLSGDFVFVGDLGRPDLLETAAGISGVMEGSARQLAASARSFLDLPDYIQVLPAHGAGSACGKALGAIPQSTVGYERRFNQALSLAEDDTAFVSNMLSGQPAPPLYFKRMKQQNRDGVPRLRALDPPREVRPEALLEKNLQVIDLRNWPAFREHHLPGALWSRTGAFFCASVGSYVEPEQQVALICKASDLDRLRRCLIRIGLDQLVAWCPSETFQAHVETASGASTMVSTPELSAADLLDRLESGASLPILDVRRGDEFEAGHLEGAVNIPHTRLMEAPERIPTTEKGSEPLLVHCLSGIRSAAACSALEREGHVVSNLAGGWAAWRKATSNEPAKSP